MNVERLYDTRKLTKAELTRELEAGDRVSGSTDRQTRWNGEIMKVDWISPQMQAGSMSITGYEPGSIKAKLEALKTAGKQRRDAALAKLDDAGKKHEHVSSEIETIAKQIEKEADDALLEFSTFTNGGHNEP